MNLKTPLMFIKTKLLFSALILSSSCSTLFNTAYDRVYFQSNEQNASVLLDGEEIGKTNQYIKIPRSDLDGYYQVTKEGCKTKSLKLEIKPTWGMWVNALTAFVVIGAYGAWYDGELQNNQDVDEMQTVNLECDKKE